MNRGFLLCIVTSAALLRAAGPESAFIRDNSLDDALYVRVVRVLKTNDRTVMAAMPIFYSSALTDKLSVDAGTVPAYAVSDMDGSQIVRAANTKIRFSYNWNDAVLATLGAKIPTGANRLSGPELSTAGNLATRQFGFQYGNVFSTLDVCGGVAASFAIVNLGRGDLSAGCATAFLYKGPFSPSDAGGGAFQPGSEFTVSAAAEYAAPLMNRASNVLLDLGYTWFGADRFASGDNLSPGSRFNWALTATMEERDTVFAPFSLRIANYRKGANVDRERNGETSRQSNDLIMTFTAGLPFAARVSPFATAGAISYSGGGSTTSNDARSAIATLAFGGRARLGEHIFASLQAGVDAGKFGANKMVAAEACAGINIKF